MFSFVSFEITQKGIQFALGDDLGILVVRLFVTTAADMLRGVVHLPEGSRLTVESAYDSTNLTGEGSWYLRLVP